MSKKLNLTILFIKMHEMFFEDIQTINGTNKLRAVFQFATHNELMNGKFGVMLCGNE